MAGFIAGTVGLPSSQDIQASTVSAARELTTPAFLTWGDPVTDPPSALGQLNFDAVMVEDHELSCEVSDHTVESGQNIVDHVRPNPKHVSLSVIVSNTPIVSDDGRFGPLTLDIPQPSSGGFLAGGTSALLDQAAVALGLMKGYPTQITATVLQFDEEHDYVQETYNQLEHLQIDAQLINIHTPHAFYSNMILQRFSLHRDRGVGTGGQFELEFREVRIVSSSIVAAPLPSIPQAAPAQDKGKQDPKPAPGPKQSVLSLIEDKGLPGYQAPAITPSGP